MSLLHPAGRQAALRRSVGIGGLLMAGALLIALGGTSATQAQGGSPTPPAHHVSPPKFPAALLPAPKADPRRPYGGQGPFAVPTRVQPTAVMTGSWTNLYPNLYNVSATAADDAWAGGEYGHLLHYTGGAWTAVDPPVMHGVDLSDLRMLSPNSGWATGGRRAFQYDGNAWQERSTGLTDTLTLQRIAPAAANDVWATIYDYSGPPTPRLGHWTGSQWITVTLDITGEVYLSDVAMRSPSDGWAVGSEYSYQNAPSLLPRIFHYDGTRWTAATPPSSMGSLDRVWIDPNGDVWTLGPNAQGGSRLYRHRGATWQGWDVPEGAWVSALTFTAANDGWAGSSAGILHWDGTSWTVEYRAQPLWSVSAAGGQVWAVGLDDTIVQRSGPAVWSKQRGGPTYATLYGVAPVSPDEAWAVGANGTFLHEISGTWTLLPPDPTLYSSFYDVAMRAPDDGYAVGDGMIAHWNGSAWSLVATPAAVLLGVTLLPDGTAWAVGTQGAIWHEVNGLWSGLAHPEFASLYSVAFDSPTHGWAVGGFTEYGGLQAVLVEYTGGAWLDRSQTLSEYVPLLTDLALTGAGEGWAVSPLGSSLHLHNGAWSVVPLDYYAQLVSIAAEAGGETLAVGSQAAHQVGGVWSSVDLPIQYTHSNGIGLIPGRGGWSVGDGGVILHYMPLQAGQRFYDVPLTSPFAPAIEYLAAHGIVAGYSDNTFRPGAGATRAQLAKMVVTGLSVPITTPTTATFSDVPPDNLFYPAVESSAAAGLVSGYACGGTGEPCDTAHRPYFRPSLGATRGQLAKILTVAKGWNGAPPATATFADVPPGNVFYAGVEAAAAHGIISGYGCGAAGEPCPGLYFRPSRPVTRGQLSKMLYGAILATGNR
ncbi:MAG: S-layer homology domain-containing protein [Chloroflexota bacterium]|nr:S-layer homology domain-containing protein [Chloroflexota bacterium]